MDDKTTFLRHYRDHIAEILGNPSGHHGVDPMKQEEWIQAQQSDTRRALARALSEQIVYVTFDEVKDMCRVLVQQVYSAIPTDATVVWWVDNKTKSGYFISLLCYHALLELGIPPPVDIVITMKTFEADRIYLKWDDMTYSGSQLEQLNRSIVLDYLKQGRTDFPDVRHCLIAATTGAMHRLRQPILILPMYPAPSYKFPAIAAFLAGRPQASVDIPFQLHVVRQFPTLDETLGASAHYACDWFFNRQGAKCAVYFDHKMADNVSTYLKVLLYGVVPPRTLEPDFENPFLMDELREKYEGAYVVEDRGLDETGIERTQFKPFLRGCPAMDARFQTWSLLPFDDFMQEYAESDGARMKPPVPDWDDAVRCPTAWYKTYFKGGACRTRRNRGPYPRRSRGCSRNSRNRSRNPQKLRYRNRRG